MRESSKFRRIWSAADAVTDLFKTMLNVTASMSVAAIVARAESTVLDQGAVISEMVPGALTSVAGAGQV